MQKVVTINLNGNAYQLDESAFVALRAYLDQAEARLKDNPDRLEILADLEQAIAEKCARFLGPNKTVVSAAEMDQVVKEMGPVEGPEAAPSASSGPAADAGQPRTERAGPRRLFRIREGAKFMGVCNGIAAYLHVDAVIVRIVFIALVFVTLGWALLGYWVLSLVIPEAQTADDRAAARGEAPFNAQDFVDQARRTADAVRDHVYTTRHEWRRNFREQRRQWRAQSRQWRWQWRDAARAGRVWPGGIPDPHPVVPPWPSVVLTPVFSLISFVCFIVVALAVVSILSTGALYGWPLPAGMPNWVAVLILIILLQIVTAPMRMARHASRYAWGPHYAWFAMWEGIVSAAIFGTALWLFFRHMPPVQDLHEFIQHVPGALKGAAQEVLTWASNLFQSQR
jgi:phage shock protein PspC (stress-responsive transcriptional regulator)